MSDLLDPNSGCVTFCESCVTLGKSLHLLVLKVFMFNVEIFFFNMFNSCKNISKNIKIKIHMFALMG